MGVSEISSVINMAIIHNPLLLHCMADRKRFLRYDVKAFTPYLPLTAKLKESC